VSCIAQLIAVIGPRNCSKICLIGLLSKNCEKNLRSASFSRSKWVAIPESGPIVIWDRKTNAGQLANISVPKGSKDNFPMEKNMLDFGNFD
jgi:hypothetical protein